MSVAAKGCGPGFSVLRRAACVLAQRALASKQHQNDRLIGKDSRMVGEEPLSI